MAIAAWRLAHLFPRLPERSAFHKRRLRLSAVIEGLIAEFARHNPGFHDDLVLVDSTPWNAAHPDHAPQQAGRRRGFCASHSRFF